MIDLAIIGGGPAGLTAAIYAARAGLRFTILERDGYGGGQITSAHLVQNYPGTGEISGYDLSELFRKQAVELQSEIQYGQVQSVERANGYLILHLTQGEPVTARAVIAATGASPKKLGIPGEEERTGKGVSYCATCDGAFYAGKSVLVIGGGDTAVEDGIYLSARCRSVTLVLRRDQFRAARSRVEALKQLANVEILYNAHALEILEGAVRLDTPAGERLQPAEGVFIAIGSTPATQYLRGLPLDFEGDYIRADETGKTSVPGLYVAGDIRLKPLRQVITAAADGANAASSAILYLSGLAE